MIRYENDCVGCPQGCIDCGRRSVPYYYCDMCDDALDTDDMYEDEEYEDLCPDCLRKIHAKKWTANMWDAGSPEWRVEETEDEYEHYICEQCGDALDADGVYESDEYECLCGLCLEKEYEKKW